MAFVLTNFIGFETGNAQEASATSGTPVYTTTAGQFVSGAYGLDMGNADEYDFEFDPAGLKCRFDPAGLDGRPPGAKTADQHIVKQLLEG